jgi:diguanylate cyclase (GGDEF)-like protein
MIPRKSPRVLVADDDPAIRTLVHRALEGHGIEVESCADGGAALEAFARRSADLLLLDVRMPVADGLAVCERIRARPGGRDVPIVMMTGLDEADSIRRAYDAGATDFVTKPFSCLVLLHRVRHLLRASRDQEELRRSQTRLAKAQSLARMGIWEFDFASRRLEVSEGIRELYGLPAGHRTRWEDLLERVHTEDRDALLEDVRTCVTRGFPVRRDCRISSPGEGERVFQTQIQILRDADGRGVGLEGTVHDVTERRLAEERIRYLAYHDSLTGLGNRVLFKETLSVALAHARRSQSPLGMLFLDLDHFKRINDTLGHPAGDALLRAVAERLRQSVRDTDCVSRPGEETTDGISRFGGDEFTILLTAIREVEDLARVARRILDALARPFPLEGHEVVVGGSIGITSWPMDGNDVDTLIRNADTAMYHAKERGRNNYQFYNESMNEQALRQLIVEGKLRRALEKDQIELHYQPRVALPTGEITGCEALVRWRDPELGMVLPGVFIPIAEEAGLIVPIGEWVLRAACRQLVAWEEAGAALPISVNLSIHQFRTGRLVETVRGVLAETGADPRKLELEITESTLLHDDGPVVTALRELRELGMRVAIDDFGTGYSSFSYLRRLPVDTLKVDRAFVKEIETSDDDAALTAAIVSMGKALRLRLVAEGVETVGQRDLLTGWGCDEMQGFLVARPLPVEELRRFRRDWSAASWRAEPGTRG